VDCPIYLKVYNSENIVLSLIDLPGLVYGISATDEIKKMISKYTKNPNSIIS